MSIQAFELMNSTPASTARVTVTGTVASDAESFTVSRSLSITAPFRATFADTGEIIEVGAISGADWSDIDRGREGTSAASHASGSAVELRITAGHLSERRPFNVYPRTTAENMANIRAAIADGYASLAPGVYTVARTASESELFLVDKAIEIAGNGATFAVADSVPNTCDLFRFVAKDTYALFAIEQYVNTGPVGVSAGTVGLHVHGFRMLPNTVSQSSTVARYGLHLDLDYADSSWFSGVDIHNIEGGGFSGASLRISNASKTDGIWNSRFHSFKLYGLISVQRGGDSLQFYEGRILAMPGQPCIDLTLVDYAGVLSLRDINGIGQSGLVKIVLASNSGGSNSNVHLERLNMEQYVQTTPATGALCYIENGKNSTVKDCRFMKITLDGSVPVAHALQVKNNDRCTVIGNQLAGGSTGKDLFIDGGTENYAPEVSNRCSRGSGSSYYSNTGTTRAAI